MAFLRKMAEAFRAAGVRADILPGEPLKEHTSFHIGGPAKAVVLPKTTGDLIRAAVVLRQVEMPYFILGKGTNLLVPDAGLDVVVLKTAATRPEIEFDGEYMTISAGVSITAAAAAAQREGLSGLEFAYGIPGTAGGAVYMNAGAYGGEMKDIVIETKYLDEEERIQTLSGENHAFSYRKSFFSNSPYLILYTKLKLQQEDPAKILARMEDYMSRRQEKQPLEFPSAGSVFKRPEGYFAGKLIQDAGLRGAKIGGAQVSKKHSGFIVNTGTATAEDVRKLIEHIQETVQKQFDVTLECEIKRL